MAKPFTPFNNFERSCGGSAAARSNYAEIVPCYMQANAGGDRLVFSFIPTMTEAYQVSFATTYPIL